MVGRVAFAVGYTLLLLTAASSAYTFFKRRDSHRLNILAVSASLAIALFPPLPRAITLSLFLAQPFFLFRLIAHFRDISSQLLYGAGTVAVLGTLAAITAAPGALDIINLMIGVVGGAFLVYAAAAFTSETHRTSGVTGKRLAFAGVGSWMLAGVFFTISFGSLVPSLGAVATLAIHLLFCGLAVCYFLAFNTPRRLRARWQRVEQAHYLSEVADRDPEERGQRAADDLKIAAERSVGHSAILVALGTGRPQDDLVVRATTIPQFAGLVVPAAPAGLVRRTCDDGAPMSGPPADCEPVLASRLATHGARVQVAPIASTSQTWGAIVVAQRHGSLFPEDDLRLLAQLARYAATALDHAKLVAEARARERRAADRRLHEVESRMALMLDSIKDYAMFVLDGGGRVATWHTGAASVFGYTAEEMHDQSAAPLFVMADPDFQGLLDEARDRGHASREGVCLRRDNARFLGATIIRPLEDEAGNPPGFVAVTRDITQQRDLESQLRQSQKMEALGRLAGGIAHDFNNMLTAIGGEAQHLELQMSGQDRWLESVGQIQKAATRASALTRQLLAFSRRRMLQPAPINLSRMVSELLPMLRRVIGEHVEVVDETPLDLPAVMGDRSQVEQVIVNLVVNARDAMPTGGRLTIRTSSVSGPPADAHDLAPGRFVLLEVADTGVGMDPATQARIFDPFFTTKEFGAGTGLGLATVYGIVRQMAGAVRVQSEPGRGTTFRLYFPETSRREAHAGTGVPADTPGGDETLLLVEDDSIVQTFLVNTLKRYGYTVLSATNATAALILAEAHPDPIHLLITDVVLPGTSGPELVREIAEIRQGMPALYISGYADAVLAQQGTTPDAVQLLQKPFTAAELLTRIRQLLQQKS